VHVRRVNERGTCKDGAQHGRSEMDLGGCSSDENRQAKGARGGVATRWQDLGALAAGVEDR
jgi:hypothetical protein